MKYKQMTSSLLLPHHPIEWYSSNHLSNETQFSTNKASESFSCSSLTHVILFELHLGHHQDIDDMINFLMM